MAITDDNPQNKIKCVEFVDSGNANTPFLRHYIFDEYAEFQSTLDLNYDGTPYTVVGPIAKPNAGTTVLDVTAIQTITTLVDNLDGTATYTNEDNVAVTISLGNPSSLTAQDIDTIAELNAIVTDATLIDTTDPRLSDARTPLAHTHTKSEITDFNDADYATAAQGALADTAIQTETDPIFTASEANNFVAGDKANLDNQSGTNTGDETTGTIQAKRPLKTVGGVTIEGSGDIALPNAPVDSVNGQTGVVVITATDVGLGNVDNTSDIDKPISTAQQAALDGKVDDSQVLTNVPAGAVFTDNDTIYDDTAIQAEVDLNTAKVSADGPISTHSDVNDIGRVTGDILQWNGTEYIPTAVDNGYTIFPIWAEESGAITSGQQQYSFGNGAVGNIGVPIPLDCELFAVSMQAEIAGTSLSIDFELNGTAVHTQVFNGGIGSFNLPTAAPVSFGDLLTFRTNTENGAYSDVRVCAWFRRLASSTLAKTTSSQALASGVAFTATTFADVPGVSTDVVLTRPGTILGTAIYSAARSGATNSEAQFRVVIQASNGNAFSDTLSTFNDNGSIEHFLENQPAGTYTVKVQAEVTQPINIAAISLKATAAED